MHWLIGVQNRSREHHACFTLMMIIAACLSHTSATFSPHCDAFDTPVFITSERLARAQRGPGRAHQPDPCEEKRQSICLIWTSFALGGADAQRAAQWDQEETKRKALEQRPCQAIGLNIIRKKRASPELMPPSVHLWHTGLHPLTSGCTSETFTRLV